MKNITNLRRIASIAGLLILISDSATARAGMAAGIENCLESLIPSLFPIMVLCTLITGNNERRSGAVLGALGKFCKIPTGCDHLLVTGCLGGYPMGARSVSALYTQGIISQDDARRLVIFCNNPGPAFIFGILGSIFQDLQTVLLLWAIQILSALLMGHFLPAPDDKTHTPSAANGITLTEALQGSVRSMGIICGWVIGFRVILEYVGKWILGYFPVSLQTLLSGLLELSNGCILLSGLDSSFQRFLLASLMLSFGGVCICLQTSSVCEKEIFAGYIPGKILQCAITCGLCLACHFAAKIVAVPLIITFMAAIPFLVNIVGQKPGKSQNRSSFLAKDVV